MPAIPDHVAHDQGAPDHVAAYRLLMDRVGALVGADEVEVDAVVPATPGWRVRDLLAHLVAVPGDVMTGRIEGVGSDPWTARQVDDRQGRAVPELFDEWEGSWSTFATFLPDVPLFQRSQIVFDAVTHEHDLRGALAAPGSRDSDAFEIGWAWAVDIVGQMRDGYQAGALVLHTERGDEIAGSGEVTGGVSGPRFELFRAMTGRRSVDQVRAWSWEGPPAFEHLCFLPNRAADLRE